MYPDRMLSMVHLERSLPMKWFLLLSLLLPSVCDAPTSVRITFPSSVRAGTWTSLGCQSDGYPAASHYRWRKVCPHSSMPLCSGSQWWSQCSYYASFEDVFCEFICTARNSVGEKDSDPIRLDIQYGPRNVEIISEDTVKEGTEITLTCRGEANPPVHTYSWRKICNRQRKDLGENTDTIRIQPTRNDASCSYICTAGNSVSSRDSTPKHINVQYKPRDFQIAHSVNGDDKRDLTSVNERDTVNISCTSQNSDPAVSGYSWYRLTQNKPVSGQILLFESISKDDSGNYQCEARNNVGTGRSHIITIRVQYAPTSVRITFPSSVRAGTWTSLTCQSNGYPAASSYRWRKVCPHSSMPLCSGSQWRSQCSYYPSVEDVGCEFICTARNSVGEKDSDPIRLDIQYGPRNVEIISEDTVKEGTEITLTCRGEANPPVHTYSWRKMCNRQRKDLGENTDTIRIQPTRNDASCSYICTAGNSVSSQDSTPKHINVQYGPRNVEIISEDTVKEGTEITLTCRGEANPQVHTYSWRKMCNRQRKDLGENTDTIRIQPTRNDASCSYICTAGNSVSSRDSTPKHINVQYAPRNVMVSISPSGSAIHEGDNITLSCTSDSNPPTSWYKWVRRQGEETEPLESTERDLTLYRITPKQEGVYSCEAGNSVGANRSEGRRIEVVRSSFRLLIGISMGLLGSVITVVLVIVCYRRKWKKTDSTSPRCTEATNTVYSVAMKRNQVKERPVYENVMMTESTDSQGHSPPDDCVEYATINFGASSQTPEGQKQPGATRGKGKKPLKARPDNDPTVIYSLINKAPSPSQVQQPSSPRGWRERVSGGWVRTLTGWVRSQGQRDTECRHGITSKSPQTVPLE
ncbi:B-cell receptor CD22-like [Hemiscyllium ocellatum]|uniref:B-cell receptor CD22-like n=1 Tax=Hemiscyllium ocellatum TaxID=170820 RepID=UPI00296721A3|nr:B-cell receptor CD22-like [Hemiscyllium ocellatum]